MNAQAINRDDGKTRGRGRAALCGCSRTSIDHHKFRRVLPPSRPTGEGFGPRRSYRLGWYGPINAIAAVRTRILAGTDERLAALLEANNSQASGAVQSLSDLPEVHSEISLNPHSSNASRIAQKQGQDRGFLSQGRGCFSQGRGGANG